MLKKELSPPPGAGIGRRNGGRAKIARHKSATGFSSFLPTTQIRIAEQVRKIQKL
jgi:hypothetical protein